LFNDEQKVQHLFVGFLEVIYPSNAWTDLW